MKRILIIVLACLAMTAVAQEHRYVRLTTEKGLVYEGYLLEIKSFEYVKLKVGGQTITIDFREMAYVDVIDSPNTAPPAPVKADTVVVKSPVVVKEPVVIKEPVVEEFQPVVEKPVVGVPQPVVEAVPESQWSDYKGFLLAMGNNVYVDCVSVPEDKAYDEAALDVLNRQMKRTGFWKLVDKPEEAHFSIVCLANTQKKPSVTTAISSLVTGNNEVLGETKGFEDVTSFRKSVWELYNKCILPLMKKIEKDALPRRLRTLFTPSAARK